MTVAIFVGDCRDRLRDLPDNSVHMCVTSPPYYGLRDYGTGSWEGGDASCDHQGEPMRTSANINANWDGGRDVKNAERREFFRDACGKCGARRVDRQIGLESSPAAFVAAMVEVFREVRRVLRPDGTLWLNLGDSYAAAAGQGTRGGGPSASSTLQGNGHKGGGPKLKTLAPVRSADAGLKPKDLIGIPWRVAFALQEDGWWLRQEIIWNKPNPMPESVQDRCTKAHEHLFLLSKGPRYYFDAAAIAEPAIYAPGSGEQERPKGYYDGKWSDPDAGGRRDGSFKAIRETRNKRTVWTVATAPYADAHFATYPPELIEPCILAGSPPGGTVLDPFGGAGTTGLVADRHQRDAVLLELNPDYAEMAAARIRADGGLMTQVAVWS